MLSIFEKEEWIHLCYLFPLPSPLYWLHPRQTMAQAVKNPSAMQKTQVRSLGREDPLEKEMATHSNNLAWRIPWTEKAGRVQSYIIPPHPMLLIFSWDFILPLPHSPLPLSHFPSPIPTLLSTLMFEYLHLQTCRPILSPVSPRFFSSILDWPLGNNLSQKVPTHFKLFPGVIQVNKQKAISKNKTHCKPG